MVNMLSIKLPDGEVLQVSQQEYKTQSGKDWVEKQRQKAISNLINQ